jgi:hypothetical protein
MQCRPGIAGQSFPPTDNIFDGKRLRLGATDGRRPVRALCDAVGSEAMTTSYGVRVQPLAVDQT